ncbi:hypothetical protein Tco_0769505 [Tanacetum coccineum]|uniref:Uncharacterized protein n=1 Tax=Tanacetum coccineum TaxID=301880 RepID=A0ABQ4Z9K4_9ASTR
MGWWREVFRMLPTYERLGEEDDRGGRLGVLRPKQPEEILGYEVQLQDQSGKEEEVTCVVGGSTSRRGPQAIPSAISGRALDRILRKKINWRLLGSNTAAGAARAYLAALKADAAVPKNQLCPNAAEWGSLLNPPFLL